VNDTIYVIGGGSATSWFVGTFGPSAVNERYTPIGYGVPDSYYVLENTPPKISVLSPANETYNNSSVHLIYAVDKPVNWTCYSIDGKLNETIMGNATLTELSSGLHNMTVYAQDVFGNIGASETIYFTIIEPFPTLLVVASVIIVAVIGAGLLVYFKKREKVGDEA
jgi:hypothetical protein